MTSADPFRVKVENVLMSSHGPVVMLAPVNGDYDGKVLPIFIDQGQALNIQLALEGQISPRPMTHDLFSAVLNELGAIVERVVIEDLAQNTFYASLYVQVEKAVGAAAPVVKRFDARPSDCIALAVRVNAPLFVSRKLMDQAAIERDSMGEVAEGGDERESEPEKVDVSEKDDRDVDLGVSR